MMTTRSMTAGGRPTLLDVVLNLLFPPRCIGCGRRGAWFCADCRAGFARLPAEQCRRCAEPGVSVGTCPDCWKYPPAFETVSCGYLYAGTVRDAIHRLKFRRARHLVEPLVAAFFEAAALPAGGDLLLPVPLYPARHRGRGYNQSELIARAIARRVDLPIDVTSIARIRDTESQMTLPAERRRANVRGAFQPTAPSDRSDLRGRHVLLVDDVCTTGSTLDAAATAARRAGAARVSALVIARAARRFTASDSVDTNPPLRGSHPPG